MVSGKKKVKIQAPALRSLLTFHRNSKWNRFLDNLLQIQLMRQKVESNANPCSNIKNDEKQVFVLS